MSTKTPERSQAYAQWRMTLTEAYHKEREARVRPSLESWRKSIELAAGYGQTVVKGAMTLNAGGFLAIPAVVVLFNIDARSIQTELIATAALFIIGLLCGVIVAVAAYFNFMALANSLRVEIERGEQQCMRYYHELAALEPPPLSPGLDEEEQEADDARTTLAWIAFCFGGAAFLALLVAASIGGYAVINAKEKAAPAPTLITVPTFLPPTTQFAPSADSLRQSGPVERNSQGP